VPVKSSVFGLFGRILDIAQKKSGLDIFGVWKAKIPAAWSGSGNPTVQQPWESAAAVGTKTHRLIQQYGHRYAAPAASDPVSLVVDRGGNRWIAGKFVDLSSHVTDSDYFMGFRPVEPGNTQILSRPAEFSTASTSFVDVSNPFQVTRPGKYRIKCELSRSAGIAEVQVVRKLRNGTVVVVGSSATENTATYPTFSATKSIDMTSPCDWGDILYLQIKQQSSGTVYIQNITVCYSDASANLTLYDAVL